MKKSLIVHGVLLLGNIGVFLGWAGGRAPGLEYQGAAPAPVYREDLRAVGAQGLAGGGLAATLNALLGEQARLREELGRLKSQAPLRQASSTQAGAVCPGAGDDSPGVTVYLDTTPGEGPPPGQPGRQWTAVSFEDAGRAPDGSRQAVMSVHKANVNPQPPGLLPAKLPARWQ